MSYDIDLVAQARLWPYLPDWSNGFSVKRTFETDIITTRDGTEQRRALRQNARLMASYRTVVSGDDRRAAQQHLYAWQNKPVVVPDLARWARLTAPSSGGSGTLTVSPLPAWAAAGQAAVLAKLGVEEQVLIASVAGTTITLANPLTQGFATGDVLRPSFFGLFDARVAAALPSGDTAAIDVSVSSYPGGEPPAAVGTTWATLGGYEVFTMQPDFAASPALSQVWPVEQIDFNRGRTAQFRPIVWPSLQSDATFNGLSVALATQAEQFFDRMKGRRGAFYLPTGNRDFVPLSYGSASITIAGTQMAADAAAVDYSSVNEGLAVYLLDGSSIFRRISSIVVSSGNSLITVDSSWGVALSSANVARISRMPLSRFASDEMTMSWRTPLAASTRFSFQQVKA